jgi:predicted phage terminase large subunit-like protein
MRAVKEMAKQTVGAKGRKPNQHLVEDKANGSAIVETLQDQISGILAVEPEGGKDSRAAAIVPQVEAGQVYLPDGAPWLAEYIGNMAGFPRAKHDDDVDQTSQMLIRMAESATSFATRFAQAHREGRLQLVDGL